MQESTIDRFVVPAPTSEDVLTQIAREGARRYLAVMIQQEVDDWLAQRAHLRDEQGRRQVVRNGYLPEREITTGVGPVKVKQPRVRDRRPEGQAEPFSSKILPPYLRKTKSIEELIPWLYLKGVSTGDFGEALKALLGPDCPGLSATTVTRLKSVWEGLLLDVKARGLVIDPKLAIGDGALGFWKALRQVYPKTREQRCWVHKTANVLDSLPKRLQPEAKQKLQAIWMADTRANAQKAFALFVATYEAKYPKAVACLAKDRDVLLTFYDFPAEHWIHLRTTNPIESTFATVRLRTKRTKGCGSRIACLTMVYKLMECASKTWRLLNGSQLILAVIQDIPFIDGIQSQHVAA